MVEMLICMVVMLAYCVFREVLWSKERHRMLDRIQSANVFEYKQAEKLDQPRKAKEKKPEVHYL